MECSPRNKEKHICVANNNNGSVSITCACFSTLPAGYHLPWLTRISQLCKTELLYLAQESCSISSYHLQTMITPGSTCSQHNLPEIWNSIHAREPVQLALRDANTWCGQMAAAWETFDHFSAQFSQDVAGENNTSSLQRHTYPHQ